MHNPSTAELASIESHDEAPGNCPRLEGIQVLVVDDDTDAREAIVALLEVCGAEVVAAASGADALRVLERARPDVLVSDIAMPGMDGHRLMRRIRELDLEQGGSMPALALTAYAAQADRTQALLEGYQVYLSKPFDPPELVVLVAKLAGVTTDA